MKLLIIVALIGAVFGAFEDLPKITRGIPETIQTSPISVRGREKLQSLLAYCRRLSPSKRKVYAPTIALEFYDFDTANDITDLITAKHAECPIAVVNLHVSARPLPAFAVYTILASYPVARLEIGEYDASSEEIDVLSGVISFSESLRELKATASVIARLGANVKSLRSLGINFDDLAISNQEWANALSKVIQANPNLAAIDIDGSFIEDDLEWSFAALKSHQEHIRSLSIATFTNEDIPAIIDYLKSKPKGLRNLKLTTSADQDDKNLLHDLVTYLHRIRNLKSLSLQEEALEGKPESFIAHSNIIRATPSQIQYFKISNKFFSVELEKTRERAAITLNTPQYGFDKILRRLLHSKNGISELELEFSSINMRYATECIMHVPQSISINRLVIHNLELSSEDHGMIGILVSAVDRAESFSIRSNNENLLKVLYGTAKSFNLDNDWSFDSKAWLKPSPK